MRIVLPVPCRFSSGPSCRFDGRAPLAMALIAVALPCEHPGRQRRAMSCSIARLVSGKRPTVARLSPLVTRSPGSPPKRSLVPAITSVHDNGHTNSLTSRVGRQAIYASNTST